MHRSKNTTFLPSFLETPSPLATPSWLPVKGKCPPKLLQQCASQMSLLLLLFLSLQFGLSSLSSSPAARLLLAQNATASASCPLDFDVLRRLVQSSKRPNLDVNTGGCQYIKQGLQLVQSEYLLTTNNFLPPLDAAESCWDSYQALVNEFFPKFDDIRKICEYETSWIAEGCMNITTRGEFEGNVSKSALNIVVAACDQSLDTGWCTSCTTSLSNLQAWYLYGLSVGNLSGCTAYPSIYAAAFANHFGPTDEGTAKCLFNFEFSNSDDSNGRVRKIVLCVVVMGCVLVLILGFGRFWFLRRKQRRKKCKVDHRKDSEQTSLAFGINSINESITIVRYTFDEIRQATKNFCRVNIIGRGGYGNVFKGVLSDGSEVALKRFKNCSVGGNATFAHEVEVIASVRHVNLVALRGYCTATTPLEGHQRIIVCDLMRNGSLHDHLFGLEENKLGWPLRQKIALGTARGLAYLHYGAQPSIIHRDIKTSNILLDDKFEPKLADFGFARFTPEGMTHLSTKVAGTRGYVAPEYALYGQLTERSDVYSFGVVLLELLSGKKAIMAVNEGQPSLVTEWAWSLVRKGRALDVIEDGMPDLGPPEIMEKYVLVAVLCSHPQLYARPTMDQVVKILDMDLPVPSIPERPIPLIVDIDDIERSVSVNSVGKIIIF